MSRVQRERSSRALRMAQLKMNYRVEEQEGWKGGDKKTPHKSSMVWRWCAELTRAGKGREMSKESRESLGRRADARGLGDSCRKGSADIRAMSE